MPKERRVIPVFCLFLAIFGSASCPTTCSGQVRVLVDQVGYDTLAPKQAIVAGSDQDHPRQFALIDSQSGKPVLHADLGFSGKVSKWNDRVFWIADFSSWQQPGRYMLQVHTTEGDISSGSFEIIDNILERNTLSNVVFYFKSQRSSGLMDRADRHLQLPGGQAGLHARPWICRQCSKKDHPGPVTFVADATAYHRRLL